MGEPSRSPVSVTLRRRPLRSPISIRPRHLGLSHSLDSMSPSARRWTSGRVPPSPSGQELFVARRHAPSIAVIDLESRAVVAELPVGEPTIDLLFSKKAMRLFVLTTSGKLLRMKMTGAK